MARMRLSDCKDTGSRLDWITLFFHRFVLFLIFKSSPLLLKLLFLRSRDEDTQEKCGVGVGRIELPENEGLLSLLWSMTSIPFTGERDVFELNQLVVSWLLARFSTKNLKRKRTECNLFKKIYKQRNSDCLKRLHPSTFCFARHVLTHWATGPKREQMEPPLPKQA